MAAGALVVSKRWQEESLVWIATAISHSTGHNKCHGQRFGLPCLPYSVLTRAGRGSFVLDFLCYFLVSRQESRGKKMLAETKMACSFILTPACRPPLSLERRGAGGEVAIPLLPKEPPPTGLEGLKFLGSYPPKDRLK